MSFDFWLAVSDNLKLPMPLYSTFGWCRYSSYY